MLAPSWPRVPRHGAECSLLVLFLSSGFQGSAKDREVLTEKGEAQGRPGGLGLHGGAAGGREADVGAWAGQHWVSGSCYQSGEAQS